MTTCEEKELIKSIALGMSFEDISSVYGISMGEINVFYAEHRSEIEEEREFQKVKWG